MNRFAKQMTLTLRRPAHIRLTARLVGQASRLPRGCPARDCRYVGETPAPLAIRLVCAWQRVAFVPKLRFLSTAPGLKKAQSYANIAR